MRCTGHSQENCQINQNSPKRAHLLAEKLAQSEESGVNIKLLCPTRWTVRTRTIGAVLMDYSVPMETLEEIYQTTHDDYELEATSWVRKHFQHYLV